jgi:hypothetical protein
MLRLQRDAVGPLPAVAVRARPVRYVYDTFVGETKVRYTRLTGERAVSGLCCPSGGGPTAPEWGAPE